MNSLKYFIKIPMNIQEINIEQFPLVIFTDTHTNLANIKHLQGLYPNSQLVCLGDITNLWNKGEKFNEYSIQFFIENKIPCLKGNHEEHISACQDGGAKYVFRAVSFGDFGISKSSLDYIKNLPTGFKINIPNGKHYLVFHNRPNDLWSFTEASSLNEQKFKEVYPIDNNTIAVLHGHGHKNYSVQYSNVFHHQIGALKYGDYALLTENGVIFKKI